MHLLLKRVCACQTWCGPRRSTEKALRCLRSSRRILSSSESGSRGLLYSSSSTSFSEASPCRPPCRLLCVELGSVELFFLHLVRRFWNHTWNTAGRVSLCCTRREGASCSETFHIKSCGNQSWPSFCMNEWVDGWVDEAEYFGLQVYPVFFLYYMNCSGALMILISVVILISWLTLFLNLGSNKTIWILHGYWHCYSGLYFLFLNNGVL